MAIKESCFAWKILYQIPATNKWRFQHIRGPCAEKVCSRCQIAIEDVVHCLFECHKAKAVWNWIQFIMPLTSQDHEQFVPLSPAQVLLGEDLICSPGIPLKWWTCLRITTMWHVWLDRNAENRQNRGSLQRTKTGIWQQMKCYLRAAWNKLHDRVR